MWLCITVLPGWTGSRGPWERPYPEQEAASPLHWQSTMGIERKTNWVTKTRRDCSAKCLLCLITKAQQKKCCCVYNQMESHLLGPGTEENKHTQAWEKSQLCSSCPPAASACKRHLKQFWFVEILSPCIYLGSFGNLQYGEPGSYNRSEQRKEVGVRYFRKNRKIVRDK